MAKRLSEKDIRAKLRASLVLQHKDDAELLLIEELAVCEGRARVDLALLNGAIHGYEIKSPDDTLARLPSQSEWYNSTFDTITIVYSGRRDDVIEAAVPYWWGMLRVEPTGCGASLATVREAMDNPLKTSLSLAQLLWRNEALALLKARGIAHGVKSKSRSHVWQRVADSIPLPELNLEVRRILRSRVNWRAYEP